MNQHEMINEWWNDLTHSNPNRVKKAIESHPEWINSSMEPLVGIHKTPLMYAINTRNKTLLNGLLEAGVDLAALSENQETYALKALRYSWGDGVISLIKAGIDLKQPDKNGVTLWMEAVKRNQKSVVNYLMNKIKDPSIMEGLTVNGEDWLMYALNVSFSDYMGRTTTEKNQFYEMIQQCVESLPVNVTRENQKGMTALGYACEKNSITLARAIVKKSKKEYPGPLKWGSVHEYNEYPLKLVINVLNEGWLNFMKDNGVNISQSIPGVDSLLIKALQQRKYNLIPRLIEEGVNVNQNDDQDNERTPLMLACWEGLMDTVDLLLKAGADVKAKDREGKEAWDWARSPDIRIRLEEWQAEQELKRLKECTSDEEQESQGFKKNKGHRL